MVRLGLSHDMAELLLDAIREEVAFLEDLSAPHPAQTTHDRLRTLNRA